MNAIRSLPLTPEAVTARPSERSVGEEEVVEKQWLGRTTATNVIYG